MKLGEPHDPFEVAGFSADSGWIVVQIDAQARRPENWIEIAQEPIYYAQPQQIASILDHPIVVGCEDVQPFSARGTACEGQKEPTEQPADTVRLLVVVNICQRLIDASFRIQNLFEKSDERLIQHALPCVEFWGEAVMNRPFVSTRFHSSEDLKTAHELADGTDVILDVRITSTEIRRALCGSNTNRKGVSVLHVLHRHVDCRRPGLHCQRSRQATTYQQVQVLGLKQSRQPRLNVIPISPWNKVAGGLTAVEGARI